MRAFKTKLFDKWASKEGLTDAVLWRAVEEIEAGKVDASLGGNVYKKRVALKGRGKRGGARVLLIYRAGDVVFFMEGFAKSKRANIEKDNLNSLKESAKDLLNYSSRELEGLVKAGELKEMKNDGRQVNQRSRV